VNVHECLRIHHALPSTLRRNRDLNIPCLPLSTTVFDLHCCCSVFTHLRLLHTVLLLQTGPLLVTLTPDHRGTNSVHSAPAAFAHLAAAEALHTNAPETPTPIQNTVSAAAVPVQHQVHRESSIPRLSCRPRIRPVPYLSRHLRAAPVFATRHSSAINYQGTTQRILPNMDGRFTPHSAHSDDALAQNLPDPMFEPQSSYNFADSHSEETRGLQPTMGSPYAPNQNQQTFFNPVDGTRLVFTKFATPP